MGEEDDSDKSAKIIYIFLFSKKYLLLDLHLRYSESTLESEPESKTPFPRPSIDNMMSRFVFGSVRV